MLKNPSHYNSHSNPCRLEFSIEAYALNFPLGSQHHVVSIWKLQKL